MSTKIPKGRKGASQISKEQLIAAIKKKRECTAKATRIVEHLIQTNINPEEFRKMIKHINQRHYEDIVEERHILKICGYPLCDTILADVPAQKYKISTQVNKVYDITFRKMFCSTNCFKASEYIKVQIPTSPLWLLDEDVPEYTLLCDSIKTLSI